MPVLRGVHDGLSVTVTAAIIDAHAFSSRHRSDHVLRGVRVYRAMIDTGATTSMLSTRVVREMELQSVNRIAYQGLGGRAFRDAFLFHIGFLDGIVQYDDPATEQGALMERVHFSTRLLNGGELLGDVSFDVLIGMDIISTGDLNICKDGNFSFTY